MKLDGNLVVFITGGASGLGEATTRYLHSKGVKVAIADQDQVRLDLLQKELGILCVKCDVTNEEDVKNAVQATVDKHGCLHVALACAGVAWPMLTLTSKSSLDTERFKKVIDINVFGSMYTAKYAAVAISKNKPVNELGERGALLFVSSVAAQEG